MAVSPFSSDFSSSFGAEGPITFIASSIAPSLAVGGESWVPGTAHIFAKPTRLFIPAAAGTVGVVTNDGSVLTITVAAGRKINLSVVSISAASTVDGVGLW